MDKDLAKKLVMEGFDKELLKGLNKPTTDDLIKFGMGLSDGVVRASAKLGKGLEAAVKATDKPVMAHAAEADQVKAHADFYHSVLEEALV